jgi:sulfate/thiosulfate transport system substrate-binding protein
MDAPRPPERRVVDWRSVLRRVLGVAVVGGLALFVAWPWLPWVAEPPTRAIVLYGFSILGPAFEGGIFPAFEQEWRNATGERVSFSSSFGASGTIRNLIALGAPAEVAIFSHEGDALLLVRDGVLPNETWRALPHRGVVTESPIVIFVRPGNPLQVQGFGDLARPGVGVVHPDPLSSGGAIWSILAEYGSEALESGNESRAYEQLLGTWRNVIAQASSARAARTIFDSGFGDALPTYEQEAVYDRIRGRLRADVVYPNRTIASENIAVKIGRNVRGAEQGALVDAFLSFLWSERAQRIFVEYGFRSVDATLYENDPYLIPLPGLFRVDAFGGWTAAHDAIYLGVWKSRVLPQVGA